MAMMTSTIKDFDALSYNTLDVEWDTAKDAFVTDSQGNTYIDFTSGIFVASCGHGTVATAIMQQACRAIHAYNYETPVRTRMLTALKEFLPSFCEKCYLACAGSEVTSWAVKAMRAYSGKHLIVHYDGAFHGKTGMAGALYNEEEIKLSWPSSYADVEPHLQMLEKYKDRIAGFMFESYRGWDASFLPKRYVQAVVEWAKKNEIPVCFDEIQSGFYRTGKKFCYEWYEIEPDLMCLGKALGGGMPVSALVGRKEFFTFDDMSSTHSANPVCLAAAERALKCYAELDQEEFQKKCSRFLGGLEMVKLLYNVEAQGVGMIGSLIFKDKETADKVCAMCVHNGLLVVNTGKKSIKFGPPLTINETLLDRGLDIITDAVSKSGVGLRNG